MLFKPPSPSWLRQLQCENSGLKLPHPTIFKRKAEIFWYLKQQVSQMKQNHRLNVASGSHFATFPVIIKSLGSKIRKARVSGDPALTSYVSLGQLTHL